MASSPPATRRRRGGAAGPDSPKTTTTTHADVDASLNDTPSSSFLQAPAPVASPAPLARAARLGSPAVLLAALGLCFDGLVGGGGGGAGGGAAANDSRNTGHASDADDAGVAALAVLLAVATVVQVAASVVGLPPAGATYGGGDPKKRKRKPNVIVTAFLALVLTALATPLVHAVLVLFGAPFLADTARTLLCAAHLAVLGLYPVLYTRGTDGAGAWRALAAGARAQLLDAAGGGLWGACAGAWLGAVPIPLDWDRPWQRWPVTVVVGAYLGHAVGRLVGGAVRR